MKTIKKLLFLMPIMLWALNASATILQPQYTTLNDRETNVVYNALNYAYIGFNCDVYAQKDVKANIFVGDKMVGNGTINADVKPYNTVVVSFSPSFKTTKGESYRLVIPEGAIYSRDDPKQTTAEIAIDFVGGEYLEYSFNSIDEDNTYDSADEIYFVFSTEIATSNGVGVELYENDVLLATYPYSCTWDWNMGIVTATFGKTLYFKKGNKYAFVLPEGTAIQKDDKTIINKEIRVEFVGTSNSETDITHAKNDMPLMTKYEGNTLIVQGEIDNKPICIFDSTGQLVFRTIACGNNAVIPLKDKGIYLMRIADRTTKIIAM